jgi:hypothetical protein
LAQSRTEGKNNLSAAGVVVVASFFFNFLILIGWSQMSQLHGKGDYV